jgi:hypothetical protein
MRSPFPFLEERMKFKLLLAVTLIAAAPLLANASSYTYNVNYNFGSFTVVGTITTDINSGVLFTTDILDWNLLLNDGTNMLDLLGPLSGNNSQTIIFGTGGPVANPNNITFDFSQLLDTWEFESPSVGGTTDYLCYAANGGFCPDFPFQGISIQIGTDSVLQHGESGVVVIATASGTTPEPSSFMLLGSGIVGLASVARRKLFN